MPHTSSYVTCVHCLLFSEFTFRFSHLCQKSYLLLIPDHHLLLGNNLFRFVIHTVFYLQLINFCLIVLLFIYFGYLLYLLNLSSKTLNFLTLGPRLKCLFFFPFSLLFPLFLRLLFSLLLFSDYMISFSPQRLLLDAMCHIKKQISLLQIQGLPKSESTFFCSDSFLPTPSRHLSLLIQE